MLTRFQDGRMKVFSSGDILALLHPGLDFIRELAAPVEVGSSPSISHRSWLFSSRTLIGRSGLRKAGFHPLSGPENLVTNLSCILLFWSRFLYYIFFNVINH